MPTFDVHVVHPNNCTEVFTVKAETVAPVLRTREGTTTVLPVYELADADGKPVLVVPTDRLLAVHRREDA